ncbi:MAG: PAS domain S-box protein [Negativicutes bacterium]|nr:PAS domain S-box protein [Negativicutes bacterium]
MKRFEEMTRDQLIDELAQMQRLNGELSERLDKIVLAKQEQNYLFEQLQSDNRPWTALLEMVPCGVSIATGSDCREIRHNPVAAEFLRIKPWESLSLAADKVPLKILQDGAEIALAELPIRRAVWHGEMVNDVELEFVWEDGVRKVAVCSARPLYDAAGNITGGILSHEEITARKAMEEELRHSESLLRAVIDNSSDPIFVKDRSGRFLMANPATEKAKGVSFAEMAGRTMAELGCDQQIGKSLMETDERIMASGQAEVVEELIDTPEGRRIFLSTKSPWRDAAGGVIGLIGVSHDIHERKLMEAELLRHRDHLQTSVEERTEQLARKNSELTAIIDGISDYFYALDKEWRFTFANSKYRKMAEEMGHDDLIGRSVWEVFPRTVGTDYYRKFQAAVVAKTPVNLLRSREYAPGWFDTNIYPYEHGVLVYFRDVTIEKQATEKIKQQTQLLELAHDYIMIRDMDNRISYWNHGAEAGYGWSRGEAVGQEIQELLHTIYPEPPENIRDSLLLKGYWEGELIDRRKDGRQIVVRSCQTLTRDPKGEPEAILEIAHDITAQKQAEELFAKAFHINPNMMLIATLTEWRFLDVNETFARSVGRSRDEIVGNTSEGIGLWADEVEREQARALFLAEGRLRNFLMHYAAKSGEQRLALLSADIITVGDQPCSLSVFTDITEQKKFEAELAHLDRLNAVGEMAAAIGHEVRNPMTTVRGYLQMFASNPVFEKQWESIDLMIEELDRANIIIS